MTVPLYLILKVELSFVGAYSSTKFITMLGLVLLNNLNIYLLLHQTLIHTNDEEY